VQIAEELKKVLETEDVAVVMDASHMCVSSRGVGDTNSRTGTSYFGGKFNDDATRREFLNYVNTPSKD
jgi:GTP cyclohydrolase I